MLKLILTSFCLALFSQVSFSVISFFWRCYFVFSICKFSLGVFSFYRLALFGIYTYTVKLSVTTIVCVCDISIDSKTISCAFVLLLIMTPTITGKIFTIYHWRNVGSKLFSKCKLYQKGLECSCHLFWSKLTRIVHSVSLENTK